MDYKIARPNMCLHYACGASQTMIFPKLNTVHPGTVPSTPNTSNTYAYVNGQNQKSRLSKSS